MEITREQSEVPEEARLSEFGCNNCLWNSIECNEGSLYKPKSEEVKLCKAYTYYD